MTTGLTETGSVWTITKPSVSEGACALRSDKRHPRF
jgi:hypothetical protein